MTATINNHAQDENKIESILTDKFLERGISKMILGYTDDINDFFKHVNEAIFYSYIIPFYREYISSDETPEILYEKCEEDNLNPDGLIFYMGDKETDDVDYTYSDKDLILQIWNKRMLNRDLDYIKIYADHLLYNIMEQYKLLDHEYENDDKDTYEEYMTIYFQLQNFKYDDLIGKRTYMLFYNNMTEMERSDQVRYMIEDFKSTINDSDGSDDEE